MISYEAHLVGIFVSRSGKVTGIATCGIETFDQRDQHPEIMHRQQLVER